MSSLRTSTKEITMPAKDLWALYDTIETLKEKLASVTNERDLYKRIYHNAIESISARNDEGELWG